MHDKKNNIVPCSDTTGTIGSSGNSLLNSFVLPSATSRVIHIQRTNNIACNPHSLGQGRSSISNSISNTTSVATTYEDTPRILQGPALQMLKMTLAHLKAHHEETLRIIEARDEIRLRLAIQDIKVKQKQKHQQEQGEQLRKRKQQLEAQRQKQRLQESISLVQANAVPQPNANVFFGQQQSHFWY